MNNTVSKDLNINISSVVSEGLCTGCGTCTVLCAKEIIKMELNSQKGTFLPKINEKDCVNCGICYKVCPGQEVDFEKLNMEIFGKKPEDSFIGNYTDCYTGCSTDKKIRFNASSGGIITQFLIFALDKKIIDGAMVTRMSKNYPLKPEPFIARTRQEIVEASQSKYCPVPVNLALKEILNAPDHEKFAVVGLPCHIHGIRKAETIIKKLKNKIQIHLGIVCGTTKNFNATRYQLHRMEIPENEVKKLSYRGEGWPGKLKVELKDDQSIFEELTDYYDGEFCSFISYRCTMCIDHVCELSDMSFGDAWIEEIKKADNQGTSIIINRTETGQNLLKKMQDQEMIELKSVDKSLIDKSQGMYISKKRKINSRFQIVKLLGKKVPVYNGEETMPPEVVDYLWSLWYYFWIEVSSRKSLWGLFRFKRIMARILS